MPIPPLAHPAPGVRRALVLLGAHLAILAGCMASGDPGQGPSRAGPSADSLWAIQPPWDGSFTFSVETDHRDGRQYRFVHIGDRRWMAENLAYAGTSTRMLGRCWDDQERSCDRFGRLYTFSEALDRPAAYDSARWDGAPPMNDICPAPWRVPTRSDWNELVDAVREGRVGAVDRSGAALKAAAGWAWTPGGDLVGFRALPGGRFRTSPYALPPPAFEELFTAGYWWMRDETDASHADAFQIFAAGDYTASGAVRKTDRLSVRCVL